MYYSSYHTGDSTWQLLTVTATISNSAVVLQLGTEVKISNINAYFDGAICVEGESITASNVIDERVPTSGVGYTITNAGNAPARVKIEVTAPGGDITDNLKIENTTTGKSFQFRGTVAGYTTLEIDNRYDTDDFQVLNDSVNEYTNFEGDFITLDPGNNTIKYTGTANAIVKITWRNCWY